MMNGVCMGEASSIYPIAAGGVPELPNFITLLHKYGADPQSTALIFLWQDVLFALLVAVLITAVFCFCIRKRQMVPTGFQNALEAGVEVLQNFVVGLVGPKGTMFVPFLGTLFLYILTMNLVGLIPLMKSPSASINITAALAICVFVFVQYLNIKHYGVRGFLYHLAGSPKDVVGWIIAPLMFVIELITQISRPFTLAMRLFGNIFGEKILVAFFATISVTALFFFPIQTPFMFLGLLTGIIQAVVFTLLSTIYIFLSMPHATESSKTHG